MAEFLIWVLCGVIGGIIAANKGRSQGGWMAVCFLLGPLGVVLALVVSKDQEAVEEKALQSGTMRKCPKCAELIKAEAIKCRYCGSEFEQLPESPVQRVSTAGSCSSCGFELLEDFAKHRNLPCPKCGRQDPLAQTAGIQ